MNRDTEGSEEQTRKEEESVRSLAGKVLATWGEKVFWGILVLSVVVCFAIHSWDQTAADFEKQEVLKVLPSAIRNAPPDFVWTVREVGKVVVGQVAVEERRQETVFRGILAELEEEGLVVPVRRLGAEGIEMGWKRATLENAEGWVLEVETEGDETEGEGDESDGLIFLALWMLSVCFLVSRAWV